MHACARARATRACASLSSCAWRVGVQERAALEDEKQREERIDIFARMFAPAPHFTHTRLSALRSALRALSAPLSSCIEA